MKIHRIAIAALALLVSVLSALPASAAMGRLDGFAFSSAANRDLAGAGTSIAADGNPDAEFTARITGTAGAIAGFSLKNLTTGQEWATSGAQNILVVADSRGSTVNGSFPMVAFLLQADYRLYANDRAAITAAGGEFELTVRFADNSTATARTTIEATAPPEEAASPGSGRESRRERRDNQAQAPGAPATGNARIINSSFRGRGNFDLSDGTKRLASNMSPDYRFDVSLAGSDTLTGIRIRATGGGSPDKLWDTVPTTANPLVVVTEQGKGTPLNARDGSISLPIRDLRDVSFWVDGGDEVARQDFRLTFLYTGGRIDEIDIKAAAPAPQAAPAQSAAQRGILMRTKPTQIALDVVGKDRRKAASGERDYSLLIEVRGDGTIKTIEAASLDGVGKWDTIPGSRAWLTIVRAGSPLGQINDPRDFSVSISVRRAETLELLMENDGTLSRSSGRLEVSVTWDDGAVTKEILTW